MPRFPFPRFPVSRFQSARVLLVTSGGRRDGASIVYGVSGKYIHRQQALSGRTRSTSV